MRGTEVRVDRPPAASARSATGRAFRGAVAAAAEPLGHPRALRLDFTLDPRRFVDLDSLVELTLGGLRDGGALARRLTGLEVVLATRREGAPGVRVRAAEPRALVAEPVPGPVAVDVRSGARPAGSHGKRSLRALVAEQRSAGPALAGDVWAEVRVADSRALTSGLEATLDTLEPVLGRDPRGQPRQEFFPNDHRITWLRVARVAAGPPLRLRLGPYRADRASEHRTAQSNTALPSLGDAC